MNKHIMVAALSAVVLTLSQPMITVQAAEASAGETPQATVKVKKMPFRGKIKTVDLKKSTITLEGKTKSRTFVVAKECKIQRDGEKCELKSIKAGESVGGLARETSDQKWEVVTLNIRTQPEAATQPADAAAESGSQT